MTDFRFDSKEEAVNHFFKEHGVGKSLYYDRKYSGQLQVKYLCHDCKNFALIISRKSKGEQEWWSLAKTANLVHATTDAATGLLMPCMGRHAASSREIVSHPVLSQVLNKGLPINEVVKIVEASGLDASIDVVKKANRGSKLSADDHLNGFGMLEPYLEELKTINSGLQYQVIREEGNNNLKRVIVMPQYTAAIIQSNYIFPVVGLDAGHMKDIIIYNESSRHQRTMLEKMFVTILSGRFVGLISATNVITNDN
jgi:hypothetical protein